MKRIKHNSSLDGEEGNRDGIVQMQDGDRVHLKIPKPQTPTGSANNQRTKRTWSLLLLPLLVVLTFGGIYIYLRPAISDNRPSETQNIPYEGGHTQPTAGTSNEQSAYKPTARTTQEYMLQNTLSSDGLTFGYIKVNKLSANNNWFVPKVHADSFDYQPIILYIGNDFSIYMLNSTTRESQKLTSIGSSNPVFSSTKQTLAYSTNECSIHLKYLDDNSDSLLKEGARSSYTINNTMCYRPLAWSPDGNKLAYIGVNWADPKLGLVSLTHLYLYDLTTKELSEIIEPDGYNTLYGNIRWLDNDNIALEYVEFGEFARIIKHKAYTLETTSHTLNETGDNYPFELSTVQIVNNDLFASKPYNETAFNYVATLVNGNIDGTRLQDIEGSEGAGSFLVKTNEDVTEATDLYAFSSKTGPGTRDSYDLVRIPLDGNTAATKLFNPEGWAVSILGWGQDYDQIIYRAFMSSHTEIRQYTISTGTDLVLIPNLVLPQ